MAARQARLTAAYGTVKVVDPATGGPSIRGFYQGAILPDAADPEDVQRLVRRGYAEWVDEVDGPADPGATIDEAPAVVEAAAAQDEADDENAADDSDDAEVDDGLAPQRPADSASKDAWVDYVVAKRDPDKTAADVRAEAKAMTKNDLIAAHG